MKDYVITIDRIGVEHGYNHDIEKHELCVTTYAEKLSETQERKIRAIAQAFFPTTENVAGSFGYSRPIDNIQLPSVQNEDKSWTHKWHIRYYVPGND